jgi:inorganic triphosphatase YgiF
MIGRDFNGPCVFETELKFQIPPEQRDAVRRALATSTARQVRLRAKYLDTPDRRLAAAGLALRLRQEDRRWLQTLKGRGDGLLERLEHEVVVPGSVRTPAVLDLARHAGTPVCDALMRALGPDGAAALQPIFETHVRRTVRVVRSGGALVEVALDLGEIRAGDSAVPICEIEFELQRGPLVGLIDLARRWAGRHALWLDVRTKAERGDRLARGVTHGAPETARASPLLATQSADAALRAIVATCLAHILPNAADVMAGVGGPEHLHQARVGLRRLRTALRLYGDWSTEVDPAWSQALADLFGRLGAARDRDALAASLLPALRSAGAPMAELPSVDEGDEPAQALRGASALWLALMAFTRGSAQAGGEASVSMAERARAPLKRLHRSLADDAARFMTLDDVSRHRARKRLKRLRYGVEFAAPLFGGKAVKGYLSRLKPAQEALGELNDLVVAESAFRAQVEGDSRAWFALGWIAAQRLRLLQQAAQALRKLSKAPKFWRDPA